MCLTLSTGCGSGVKGRGDRGNSADDEGDTDGGPPRGGRSRGGAVAQRLQGVHGGPAHHAFALNHVT